MSLVGDYRLSSLDFETGVREVGIENRLIPKRSDEDSSTLPPLEEEPQNSSYAAAGRWG